MKKTILLLSVLLVCCAGCRRRGSSATYTQKAFIFNVPAMVRVYGPDAAEGKELADEIFAEWNRIAGELSYSDNYSLTSLVNKKAAAEWVPVTSEFLRLLILALDYSRITEGAFDITFAPLWPLWKEAASNKRLPSKEAIEKALLQMGYGKIQVDVVKKRVHFTAPVQINLGGLLRGYCFERAFKMLKEKAPPFPVQLRLGGNTLVYGDRNWRYRVPDPSSRTKIFGRFRFREGLVMSSSGRDVFVKIEGKLYSHILDLRTGYPIKDFSSLTVYYPSLDNDSSLVSAALAVMGREKAFKFLSGIKGTAAVWVDGAGKPHYLLNPDSKVQWEADMGMFNGIMPGG
ncbi:MAG: hypothetical protein COT18_09295 [Elusimicrobia bacterium CG08_land_8_20_14_0_20_59_10]|nr:MAG: hypothetical protein COT18_09295 [Elusimicrobia bacterium CG08_land_8_20_14_0_20_59_10]